MANLRELWDNAMHASKKRTTLKGFLGDGQGNVQGSRANYVKVRIAKPNGAIQYTEAQNLTTQNDHGAPVLLAKNIDDELEVVGYDFTQATGYYTDSNGTPFAPPSTTEHAFSHQRLSTDPIELDALQVKGLSTRPNNSPNLSVFVTPYVYDWQGTYGYWQGGTLDLSSYVPSGLNQQRVVLVGLNKEAGTLEAIQGTIEVWTGLTRKQNPFTGADLVGFTNNGTFEPSAGVRLLRGQSQIQTYDIFTDARQWGVGGGASTGGGAIVLTGTVDVLTHQVRCAVGTNPYLEGSDSGIFLATIGEGKIALYDDTAGTWFIAAVGSTSLGYGAVSDEVRDVYLYWDGTNVLPASRPFERPLQYQDGVAVKVGTPSYRHAATLYTINSTVYDIPDKRNLWNRYNQIEREFISNPSHMIADYNLTAANGTIWKPFQNNADFGTVQITLGDLSNIQIQAISYVEGTNDYLLGISSGTSDNEATMTIKKPASVADGVGHAVYGTQGTAGHYNFRMMHKLLTGTGDVIVYGDDGTAGRTAALYGKILM